MFKGRAILEAKEIIKMCGMTIEYEQEIYHTQKTFLQDVGRNT